jgi:hypothetical protein
VNAFTTQLHLIAQMDSDQWINFLILLIMAVFWLFGTLIKAAAKRRPPQAGQGGPAGAPRETWQQRLAKKAEEIRRAAEAQRRQADERIRRMEERATMREQVEQPSPGGLTVRTGRGGESILVYEQGETLASSAREHHAARQQEAKNAVSAAGREASMTASQPVITKIGPQLTLPSEDMTVRTSLEPRSEPAVGYEPGSIIDYNDPDALRKAILHYEILARPVGLRDELERSAF